MGQGRRSSSSCSRRNSCWPWADMDFTLAQTWSIPHPGKRLKTVSNLTFAPGNAINTSSNASALSPECPFHFQMFQTNASPDFYVFADREFTNARWTLAVNSFHLNVELDLILLVSPQVGAEDAVVLLHFPISISRRSCPSLSKIPFDFWAESTKCTADEGERWLEPRAFIVWSLTSLPIPTSLFMALQDYRLEKRVSQSSINNLHTFKLKLSHVLVHTRTTYLPGSVCEQACAQAAQLKYFIICGVSFRQKEVAISF